MISNNGDPIVIQAIKGFIAINIMKVKDR